MKGEHPDRRARHLDISSGDTFHPSGPSSSPPERKDERSKWEETTKLTTEKELREKPPEPKDEGSKPEDQIKLKGADWIEEMHQAKSLELKLNGERRISTAQILETAKPEISRIATLVIGYMVKLHPFIGEEELFALELGTKIYESPTVYREVDCKSITLKTENENYILILDLFYEWFAFQIWYGTLEGMTGLELKSEMNFYLAIRLDPPGCRHPVCTYYAIKDLRFIDDMLISQLFKLIFDCKKRDITPSAKLVDNYITIDSRPIILVYREENKIKTFGPHLSIIRQTMEDVLNTTEMGKSVTYEASSKREPIPPHVRREVWRRDEGKCVKCGSREKLEFDHIIPLSRGGSNTERNIELLCERCNRGKHAKIG